jgi:hypothetical protein
MLRAEINVGFVSNETVANQTRCEQGAEQAPTPAHIAYLRRNFRRAHLAGTLDRAAKWRDALAAALIASRACQ